MLAVLGHINEDLMFLVNYANKDCSIREHSWSQFHLFISPYEYLFSRLCTSKRDKVRILTWDTVESI